MSVPTRLEKLHIAATCSDSRVTLAESDMAHLLDALDRHEAAAQTARWETPLDPSDRRDPRNTRR